MGRGKGNKPAVHRQEVVMTKQERKKVSASMQARWDKMQRRGKQNFVLIDVMLLRQIFLVAALLFTFEFLLFRNTTLTMLGSWWTVALRFGLAAINGYATGLLEWSLIDKLVHRSFPSMLKLWWHFVLVYGILGYGVPLGLCMPYLPETPLMLLGFGGLYLGAGLIFGAVMFGFSAFKGASGWKQFVK